MFSLRKNLLPVLLAGIWISISEFVRNELLLKNHWVDHYNNMVLVFPSEPINGAVWGIWSLLFTIGIYIIYRKFKFWETVFLSWFLAFVLMWLVLGNMNVLPFKLLIYAIPLSILECLVAVFIIDRLTRKSEVSMNS